MKVAAYSPTIRRKEMNAVLSVMVEDKIGPGEQSKLLVQTAKEKLKFETCLALRSPAIALFQALKSLGLEKGDGVLISALSPLYYNCVIEDLGLKTVYSDVLPSTASMSFETIEKALQQKPDGLSVKCIVKHHTLGYLGVDTKINELGIPVIEDSSRSYGTVFPNDDTANDNAKVFSILGLEERDLLTSGGGALLYSSNRRSSRSVNLPDNMPQEYGLPDMNAALAVIQFKEAEKHLSKRREIAELYTQSALRSRHMRFIQQGADYNNYAFPLILKSGLKDVKTYARKKEIEVESAFENTPAGNGLISPEACPEAYSLSLRTVLFPLYPTLKMADAGRVAKIIQTLP